MTSLIALLSQMMYDVQTQQNLRSLHVVHILYLEVSFKVIALEKRHIIHYSHSTIFLCLGIFLNISWAYIYWFDIFRDVSYLHHAIVFSIQSRVKNYNLPRYLCIEFEWIHGDEKPRIQLHFRGSNKQWSRSTFHAAKG